MSQALVMIPTRDRPQEAKEAVLSVFDTSQASVCVYVDQDQEGLYEDVWGSLWEDRRFHRYLGPRIGPVASANAIAQRYGNYAAYGLITDDSKITTKGWDEWLLEAVERLPICVVSPYHNNGDHVDMPFVTRQWIDTVGWYACPDCWHYSWPTITGLIGEMTAIVHAPQHRFAIHHDYQHGTNPGARQRDAEAFYDYVSLNLRAVVEKVREAMA